MKTNSVQLIKPYRVPTVHNKPLLLGARLNWVVQTIDPTKSFTFSTGSEFQAMHIWRTQCSGSEILQMYSYTRSKGILQRKERGN